VCINNLQYQNTVLPPYLTDSFHNSQEELGPHFVAYVIVHVYSDADR